jgi:MoaA/NifB/PqqE/SkfB family radical SAM enzyme
VDAGRLVVVWRVSERCDTACGFCAYDASLRRTRRELREAEALRFGALLAEFARACGREVLLAWLGGEPWLWPPLESATRALRSRGLRMALTSNGRAFADPARLRFAVEQLDELTLSLDGPPALHDQLRRSPGLGAIVVDALRKLRALRGGAARPLLRVNAVLMRDNVERFEELVAAAADAGADELTFNQLGGRDRPSFHAEQRLHAEDVARLRAALPLARRRLRIPGDDRYLSRLAASAAGEALAVTDCGPGGSFWFVEVDGTLAPCSFTTGSAGVPIETLRNLEDLIQLPARLSGARARARPACCGDCPSTQVHRKFAAAGA